jgi:HPt (histidine-containing phosphotransfer) domain-containing protein
MRAPSVLDPSVLASLRQLSLPGEPDVLTEVLTLFLSEVPPKMTRLRNACSSGNIEEMQRAAHSLKGSAGNIGAQGMFDVCRQLDGLGRSGNLEAASTLVAALDVEFDKVQAEIRRLLAAYP